MNDCYTNEFATHYEGCRCHEDAWHRRLDAVTAQRDRLAEALNDLWYGHNLTGAAYELIEEALAAVKGAEAQKPPAIPDILFDGFAVYSELNPREKHYTTPENVSAVLDAIVRIMRRDQQALAAVKGGNAEIHGPRP